MPKHSLATAAMLEQNKARATRGSKDEKDSRASGGYLMANSISASNDITPSF